MAAGEDERVAELLDATYDFEAWAPDADARGVRERLDTAIDGGDPPRNR